ncbi:MAG: hypothetical protein KKB51_12720 [Candidatus Riflebacteria bacterium]|nr:hypothetical protein [Candidatus Riflebacteria bacterium]
MKNRKSGMAIIIVLVMATALLTLAGSYIQSSRNAGPTNDRILERVQADFWGHGIAQLALLKFKQLPSEFYYAYNFSVRDKRVTIPDPWGVYLQSPLQGNIAAPIDLNYSTNCRVLGQTRYKVDSIEFEVILEGDSLRRSIKETINSTRIKN